MTAVLSKLHYFLLYEETRNDERTRLNAGLLSELCENVEAWGPVHRGSGSQRLPYPCSSAMPKCSKFCFGSYGLTSSCDLVDVHSGRGSLTPLHTSY